MIEANHSQIMAREMQLLTSLVTMSVRFKAAVVSEDERETGLRRILNFGHTFGHAIEMKTGFMHGFAVASGMEIASYYSLEKGLITIDEKERILNVLNKYRLLLHYSLPADQIEALVMHDKKKAGSGIHFIFTEGIGKAVSEKISVSEAIDFYKRFIDK